MSNFFRFFAMHFEDYGLKRLITTCYKNQDVDLFSTQQSEQAVYLVYDGDKNGNGEVDVNELDIRPLKGDGDFRSAECVELLKQADIVVTNPPFSLFREYVAQLMRYQKKFLIIGSVGATGYKEIFPLIRENKIWLGYGFQAGNAYFAVPKDQKKEYAKGVYDDSTGLVHFRNCTWYTNLDHDKRHEPLILYRKYNSVDFPKYANFDAIDVNKVSEIPGDYYGAMGVPVTFLDKYCPEQFEIIGLGSGYLGQSIGIGGIPKEHKVMMKGHSAAGDLYLMINGQPKVPYSRILIRRKQQTP